MQSALLSILLQATFLISPVTGENRKDVEQVASILIRKSPPNGTVIKPMVVASGEIRTPERLISLHKEAETETIQKSVKSIAPTITRDVESGCRKLSDHPRGFQLMDESSLNGHSTLYQCDGFVTEVIAENYSRPLTVITGVGFSPANMVGRLNGGTLSKNFRLSQDGVRQLVYVWIGGKTSYTVELTSRRNDFQSLQSHGDRILSALTENALRPRT